MEVKKTKTPQSKLTKVKQQEVLPKTDWYTLNDLLSWRSGNLEPKKAEYLIKELDEWSAKPTALRISDFRNYICIPKMDFKRYRDAFPKLELVYEHVIQRIGSRRENLAIFDQAVNAPAVLKVIRIYNEDHREIYDEDQANKMRLQQPTNNNEKIEVIAIREYAVPTIESK